MNRQPSPYKELNKYYVHLVTRECITETDRKFLDMLYVERYEEDLKALCSTNFGQRGYVGA